jgi:UDP-3-O-[3-hydroxymyristoyl] glucosamine N-acyltransferase
VIGQIGHNVIIGDCCFLCGHVALGGSSELGRYVVMGGKSAVADHVTVCSKVNQSNKKIDLFNTEVIKEHSFRAHLIIGITIRVALVHRFNRNAQINK